MKIKNALKKFAVAFSALASVGVANAAGTDVSGIVDGVDLSGASAGIVAIGVAIGALIATGIAVRHVLGMMKRL